MADWSLEEVEVTVVDYLEMLAAELNGTPYSKTAHRHRLAARLPGRSQASIEFKHANISAVLIDLGFPYVAGYKPRSNYQALLFDVVAEALFASRHLQEIAQADADRPSEIPQVKDILGVLVEPPAVAAKEREAGERRHVRHIATIDYLEREARNQSLGRAGEKFVVEYERARLIRSGQSRLADKIEHVSLARGDGDGFDILSFEPNGKERLIEVKTTKYGKETPFFLSRNELSVSESQGDSYHLYRLFRFRELPRLFVLDGAISGTCALDVATYIATLRIPR